MSDVFTTVLLLALPASGKSELRHLMANIEPERLEREFHIGENLQLDDFPYVHFMRRIDEELERRSAERVFYPANELPFFDSRDWGTLIELLNADYDDLMSRNRVNPSSMAEWLFDRIDRAALTVDIKPRMALLKEDLRHSIAQTLEAEAREIRAGIESQYAESYEGKTLVIECARGGADGSEMPLSDGHGYQFSLPHFTPRILRDAAILYVWVTPEESRRKNEARANPDDPGSNLFHGVPLGVMLGDYGTDDMPYLQETSERDGYITVDTHETTYYLPIGVFDNRVDKTSFLRAEPHEWDAQLVDELCGALREATETMWSHLEQR
ncbi:MAG: hypothetical protein IJ125_07485 [Atopobiaceae bacterium]|nr:hypothetical protein [Atopobiaceae bacterium]